MLILNVAAGKLKPILEGNTKGPHVLVNLDTSYYAHNTPEEIENLVSAWWTNARKDNVEYYCKEDAFQFMERTSLVFDRICLYRFLEHVSFDQVLYFIYLLSTVTRKGQIVDVIVPNYNILAKMLLAESPIDEIENFEAHNILLTTEMLNEPGCPHASIWTPERAIYFWELEKRFVIENGHLDSKYEFDGRDIYLRFKATRI